MIPKRARIGMREDNGILRMLDRFERRALAGMRTANDHADAFAQLRAGAADAFASDDVLLYGLIATSKERGEYKVVGEYLSYDPYGLMNRKDDPDFTKIIESTFHRLAETREILRIYNEWFQRRLPGGEQLGIPISPQLEEIFHLLGLPD